MKEYIDCLETLTQEYDFIMLYDTAENTVKTVRKIGLFADMADFSENTGFDDCMEMLCNSAILETDRDAFIKKMNLKSLLQQLDTVLPMYTDSFISVDGRNKVFAKIAKSGLNGIVIALEYRNYVVDDALEYLPELCFDMLELSL